MQCDHRRFPEQWQVLSTLAFETKGDFMWSDFRFLSTAETGLVELIYYSSHNN